jgi:hypothetical protein
MYDRMAGQTGAGARRRPRGSGSRRTPAPSGSE